MATEAGRFDELYAKRQGPYAKEPSAEEFLEGLNEYLQPRELRLYRDYPVEHPFFFVVGLPRSGTTLISQLLAYCLDAGYVNNFVARFWRAPVHGIRLSRVIVGEPGEAEFESDYARTKRLTDIHEYGYFWRHWLEKHTFDDVVRADEREDEIDWPALKRTLANVQQEFGKPFVAKNMLGAYHMAKLRDVLEQVVWVYIERDPLDVAVSILDARRKYYSDPNAWWSYVPPEYPLLAGRDYREQIAGQIHYLARFYDRALGEVGSEAVVRVTYDQLCRDPAAVLDAVATRAESAYGRRPSIRQRPPQTFPFRAHRDREADKETFRPLLASLQAEDP
ncbi:MAG: sulfotransferase [Thermoleophilia bacterium]|nr:sulfotransferase [Thermoleophilia bacterium]